MRMSTKAPEKESLQSVFSASWRFTSLLVASVLALAVYVGLTIVGNPYVALAASIGIGPLLVLPMTRRIVWLVLASVASLALAAAIAWTAI